MPNGKTDNIATLYNALSGAYNLGTLDHFREVMGNESARHSFYDAVSKKYNLGDYNYFDNFLGPINTGEPGQGLSQEVVNPNMPETSGADDIPAETKAYMEQQIPAAPKVQGVETQAAPQATNPYQIGMAAPDFGKPETSRYDDAPAETREYLEAEKAQKDDYSSKSLEELQRMDTEFRKKNGAFMDEYKRRNTEFMEGAETDLLDYRDMEWLGENKDKYEAAVAEANKINLALASNAEHQQNIKTAKIAEDELTDEITKEAAEFAKSHKGKYVMAPSITGGGYTMEVAETDPNLNAASMFNNRTKKVLDQPSVVDKHTKAGDYVRGIYDGVVDIDWLTRGLTEGKDRIQMRGLQEKLQAIHEKLGEKGEYETDAEFDARVQEAMVNGLTDSEKVLLKAYTNYTNALVLRDKDVPNSYKGGQMFADTMGYMIDFAMTGTPAKGAADFVATKMGEWALKNFATKAITRVVSDLAGAAVRTPLMVGQNLQAYGERLNETNEDGSLAHTRANAKLNTGFTQFGSTFSEGVGEYLQAGERLLVGRAFAHSTMPKGLIGRYTKEFAQGIGRVVQAGQFQGYFAENFEELYDATQQYLLGAISSGRLGDKEALKQFFDKDTQIQMLYGFGPLTAVTSVGSLKAWANMKARYEEGLNYVNDLVNNGQMDEKTKEKFDELVSQIENTTNGDYRAKMAEICSDVMQKNGSLPEGFLKNLGAVVEGKLSYDLQGYKWNESGESMQLAAEYASAYGLPLEQNAFNYAYDVRQARNAAFEAGIAAEEMDKDALSIMKDAIAVRENNGSRAEEQYKALSDLAIARAHQEALKDGYEKQVKDALGEEFQAIDSKLDNNGNVIGATYKGESVFVTTKDVKVVGGKIEVDGGDGNSMVTISDGMGNDIGAVKVSELEGAFAQETGNYKQEIAANAEEQAASGYEAALNTISDRGKAQLSAAAVGKEVRFTDPNTGAVSTANVLEISQGGGGAMVLVKGDKKAFGETGMMWMSASHFYDLVDKTAEGAVATGSSEGTPAARPQPAAPAAPKPQPAATAPEGAPAIGELQGNTYTISYNGLPSVNVEVTGVDERDGTVSVNYKDAEGNDIAAPEGAPLKFSYNDFLTAMESQPAEAPSQAETPVAAPAAPAQPATPTEAPQVAAEEPQPEAPKADTFDGLSTDEWLQVTVPAMYAEEMSEDERSEFVSQLEADLSETQEKKEELEAKRESDKPKMTTDLASYQQAKKELREKYDEQIAAVQKDIDEKERRLEGVRGALSEINTRYMPFTPTGVKTEFSQEELEPHNPEEAAAKFISDQLRIGKKNGKPFYIDTKSFKEETGFKGETKSFFMLFKKGGVTIGRLAEDLADAYPGLFGGGVNAGQIEGTASQRDDQAARDAILSLFGEVRNTTDINNYILNNRKADAAREAARQNDEIIHIMEERFGMPIEEYESQREAMIRADLEEMLAFPIEGADFLTNLREYYKEKFDYVGPENSQGNQVEDAGDESGAAEPVSDGGGEVLPGAQSVGGEGQESVGGDTGSAESTGADTGAGDGAPQGGRGLQAPVAEEETEETPEETVSEETEETTTEEETPVAETEEEVPENNEETASESQENSVSSEEETPTAQEPVLLTEDEIRNSGYEDPTFIEQAVDYINGNTGNPLNQIAYQVIENYVRNKSGNTEQVGGDAGAAQLAGGDTQVEGAAGDRSGGESVPVDSGRGTEGVSGDNGAVQSRGEGNQNGSPSATGEPGNSGTVGGEQSVGGNSAEGVERRRGAGTGQRGRKLHNDQERTGNGGQPVGEDAGRNPQARIEQIDSEIDDLLGQLGDLMKDFGKPGDTVGMSIVPGLSAEQLVKLAQAAKITSQIGFKLIQKGYYALADYVRKLTDAIGVLLKKSGFTDEQIEDFIRASWDSMYSYNGEVHRISEWASILKDQELRKLAEMGLDEKRKMQKEANDRATKVQLGDIANIREQLPFLLPHQHDNVAKAEQQFFSEEAATSHARAYGKGMMFTDGTGTGKTYTGLGIIKRFVNQGKKRILLVCPAGKVADWQKDAANMGLKPEALKTKGKGSGFVVMSIESFRANKDIMEDTYDLVVYDEAHKMMGSVQAAETQALNAHFAITNRDKNSALLRIQQNHELWKAEAALKQTIEHQQELFSSGDAGAQEVIDRANGELKQIQEKQEKILPELEEKAEEAVKNTKVLFLTATPFTSEMNMRYADGYIFNSQGTAEQVVKHADTNDGQFASNENDFDYWLEKTFPARFYISNGKAKMKLGNAAKLDEQEMGWNEWAKDAGVLSGQKIDIPFDYSRDFPQVSIEHASDFNSAWEDIRNSPQFSPLAPFFKHLENYNWTSYLFEVMKVSALKDRIDKHLAMGRKVVIFNRRRFRPGEAMTRRALKEAGIPEDQLDDYLSEQTAQQGLPPMGPPFRTGLDLAMASGNPKAMAAAAAFAVKYASLLEWEKPRSEGGSLDYRPVEDQFMELYASDKDKEKYNEAHKKWEQKVEEIRQENEKLPKDKQQDFPSEPRLKASSIGLVRGSGSGVTNNTKLQDQATFNTTQDMNIIIVQEASGKEGISLHDMSGDHQRVLISTALPQSPLTFIQIEGRIYRLGNKSDAIYEYPLLGINLEVQMFAGRINNASQTTENLAMGNEARGLRESIKNGIINRAGVVPLEGQGHGGKEFDQRSIGSAFSRGFDGAIEDYSNSKGKLSEAETKDPDMAITPHPLGYKMSQWGRPAEGETYLEPSAGRGTIAQYVPATNSMTALETNGELFTKLSVSVGGSNRNTQQKSIRDYSTINKHDIILLHPPVGENGVEAAEQFIESAKHLEEGGRIIAVIPQSLEFDGATSANTENLIRIKGKDYTWDEFQSAYAAQLDAAGGWIDSYIQRYISERSSKSTAIESMQSSLDEYKDRLKMETEGHGAYDALTKRINALQELIDIMNDKSTERIVPGSDTSVYKILKTDQQKSDFSKLMRGLVRVGEVKLPDFAISGGIPMKVVVYDQVSRAETRKKVPEAVSYDVSDATDMNDFFEKIRNLSMPNRTVDTLVNVMKAGKRFINSMRENSDMFAEKEGAKNSIDENYIIFYPRKITNWSGGIFGSSYSSGNWYSLSNIFPFLAGGQEKISQRWARAYTNIAERLKLSDEEYARRISKWGDRTVEKAGAVRMFEEGLLKFLRDASGLTETQIGRVAQGLPAEVNESDLEGDLTYDKLKAKFDIANGGDDFRLKMFNKVLDKGQKSGMGLEYYQSFGNDVGKYVLNSHSLQINSRSWNRLPNDVRATVICHEAIHSATSLPLRIYEKLQDYDFDSQQQLTAAQSIMSSKVLDTCDRIFNIYRAIQRGEESYKTQGYGLTNAHEMLAELSNPDYRKALESRSLWKTQEGRYSGFEIPDAEKTDAFTEVSNAANILIDSFETEDYEKAKDIINGVTPNYHKAEGEVEVVSPIRAALRDALTSIMSGAGIKVHMDGSGQAILDAAKRKNVNKEQFFRNSDGVVYGFTHNGEIYLDPNIAGPETAIHEYTHLWAQALRENNPTEWQNIVSLMKGETALWDKVKADYPELTDENKLAEEVLAHYSGKHGARGLEIEQDLLTREGIASNAAAIRAIGKIREALNRFWKAVADFLHIHYESAEQVADQVLKDLLNGVNPARLAQDQEINSGVVKASNRTKPAPKRTIKGYKLFTVDRMGRPHALFIDAAMPLGEQIWYDAESPKLEDLEKLEPGVYYVDAAGNYTPAAKRPSKAEVENAATNGGRYMMVSSYASGEKSYYNYGINGSGSVSVFALRPGWHLTTAPTMQQLGAADKSVSGNNSTPVWRRADQRWFEVEVSADIDYGEQGMLRPGTNDMQTMPTDGFYYKATNGKANTEGQDWIIAGSLKIVRALNEDEVRAINEEKGTPQDLPYKDGIKDFIEERPRFQKSSNGELQLNNENNIFADNGRLEEIDNDGRQNRRTIPDGAQQSRRRLASERRYLRVYEERLAAQRRDYLNNTNGNRPLQSEAIAEVGRTLIEVSKNSGQYFTPSECRERFGVEYRKQGSESITLISKDGKTFTKLKDPFRASGKFSASHTPYDVLKEVIAHNVLFPDTAYRFIGVTEEGGKVRIILQQENRSSKVALRREIWAYMAGRGFDYSFRDEEAKDNDVIISDLSPDNLRITPDMRVYVIDPVFNFKTNPDEALDRLAKYGATNGLVDIAAKSDKYPEYADFVNAFERYAVKHADGNERASDKEMYEALERINNELSNKPLNRLTQDLEDYVANLLEDYPNASDIYFPDFYDSLENLYTWAQSIVDKPTRVGVKLVDEWDETNTNPSPVSGIANSVVVGRAIDNLGDKLHVKVNKISREQMPKGYQNKKGYFNPRTGEVYVCTDNVASVDDAIATVMHEAVAHLGLRRLLGDQFPETMRSIYEALDRETRRRVNASMSANGWDAITAMEEYMAGLAEKEAENFTQEEKNLWQKIKDIFQNVLAVLTGRKTNLTDNDLRYILRASYENLRNPRYMETVQGWAKDLAMKSDLKVNDYVEPEYLFRTPTFEAGSNSIKNYEDALAEKWQVIQMEHQDAQQSVRIAINAIQAETGNKPIGEDEDYITKENLASSIAQAEQDEFLLFQVKPILEAVRTIQQKLHGAGKMNAKQQKAAYNEIITYLYAKHGAERNRYSNTELAKQEAEADAAKMAAEGKHLTNIERKQYEPKDWSGLTSLFGLEKTEHEEAERLADDLVAQFEGRVGQTEVDSLWDAIRAATDYNLKHALDHGLLTRAEYDKLHGNESAGIPRMWEYYVPLRGFKEDTAEDRYNYSNITHQQANTVVTKKYKGRTSLAEDPIANLVNIGETEIAQGNSNLAKIALYKFALNRSDNKLLTARDVWYEKQADGKWMAAEPRPGETLEEFENRMQMERQNGLARVGRRGLSLDMIMANTGHKAEHLIRLKINGSERAIWVNGNPALARAVAGSLRAQNMKAIRTATRTLSNMFTSYSIDFTARNLFRDMLYSRMRLMAMNDPKYLAQYRKNWWNNFGYTPLNVPMVRLISQWQSGKLQQKANPTERERLFMDFMRDGGATGYTITNSVDRIKKDIMRQIANGGRGERSTVSKVLWFYPRAVQALNEAYELLTRFTAYETSRQLGRSGQTSASDAKEISVNFNRKGAQTGRGFWGVTAAFMGATHYFYNAGVQGFQNFMNLYKNHPYRMGAMTGGLMVAGFMTPFINALLAAFSPDGDDDDWYWTLPQWVRRNNIVIGWKGTYIAIPLAVEQRAIYGLGDIIAAFADRKVADKDFWSVAFDVMNQAGGILPINPVEDYTSSGNVGDAVLRTVMPDATMVFLDWATNRDYTGRPLAKENPYNDTTPNVYGAYSSTPSGIVKACEVLAKKTGIDLKPGYVRDAFKQYLGGIYSAFEEVSKFATGAINPDKPMRVGDVPFVSGFVGHIDEDRTDSFVRDALYDYKTNMENVIKRIKIAAGDKDGDLTPKVIFEGEMPEGSASVQRIYEGRKYELAKMYREGMNGPEGVTKLRKVWNDAKEEYAKMPKETTEEKQARAEQRLAVQDAWQKYYDAECNLVDRLLNYEAEGAPLSERIIKSITR